MMRNETKRKGNNDDDGVSRRCCGVAVVVKVPVVVVVPDGMSVGGRNRNANAMNNSTAMRNEEENDSGDTIIAGESDGELPCESVPSSLLLLQRAAILPSLVSVCLHGACRSSIDERSRSPTRY